MTEQDVSGEKATCGSDVASYVGFRPVPDVRLDCYHAVSSLITAMPLTHADRLRAAEDVFRWVSTGTLPAAEG